MIQTDKKEILIGLLSDTHVPQRTNKVPDVVIDDFKNRKISPRMGCIRISSTLLERIKL